MSSDLRAHDWTEQNFPMLIGSGVGDRSEAIGIVSGSENEVHNLFW